MENFCNVFKKIERGKRYNFLNISGKSITDAIIFGVISLSFLTTPIYAQNDLYVRDLEYYNSVLERKCVLQNDSMHNLERKLNIAKVIMLKENLRKKAWIKVVIGETVLVAGVTVGLITGAWVPVLMTVGVIEFYLLIEGKYRLNIKKLKMLRREAKTEKLSNYLK